MNIGKQLFERVSKRFLLRLLPFGRKRKINYWHPFLGARYGTKTRGVYGIRREV